MRNLRQPIRQSAIAAAAACIAATFIVAVLDLMVPGQFDLAVLYIAIVSAAAWTRSWRFVWGLAAVHVLLTFAALRFGAPPVVHEDDPGTSVWFNRSLSAVGTLCAAAVVHLWIVTTGRLEESHASLEEQNEELAAREEEIARQNEELQSQTEELERQREELRLTNEELARREHHLQALLDLSRSLVAGLSQDETMSRICASLTQLINHGVKASAILERRGNRMRVRCHEGFGTEGLRELEWPCERTLAALIAERNQTAYIEDLSLRPDLLVPQAVNEQQIRSLLAAPLRMRGQVVGSVEVYSVEKQSWTDEQVSLVESLAAQASISLESAVLFEQVDQERRRFETVFRTLPIGIAVTNAEMTETRVNPAGAAMMNIPTDVNIASPTFVRPWQIFRAGRPTPAEQYPLRRAGRGEVIQGEEMELSFPSGRRAFFLVSATPIRDREGNPMGAVCAFTDITAQKELQRELEIRRREAEEASVRKTRFLAAVSHDIRTPANAISLMAELIRRTAANPALAGQIPQMASELQQSTATMVELVSDVLDVARFDTGKVDLQESTFPLAGLLNDEGRQLLPLARDKGLALVIDLPEAIQLQTDRIKLGRIIANLGANAIKYTNKGTVQISARRQEDGSVRIEVGDTGIGIAPEHTAQIFDEFYQLRNPERDRNKGTGLGLAICKRLIDAMGGAITVQSQVGEGSTFTVTLPPELVRPGGMEGEQLQVELAQRTNPSDGVVAGRRVLVIEDHHGTRSAIVQLLQGEGATVLDAMDGATGLRMLREEPVHLLLLDLMLPDISGREILRQIQIDRPAELEAIFVLTGDLIADEKELKALGANALCPKPITMASLMNCIAAVRARA